MPVHRSPRPQRSLRPVRRVAALLAVALAAACGGTATTTSAPGRSADCDGAPAAGSTLRVYSWADYLSPDNIAAFTEKTGVKIAVDAYASSEEALAKLRLSKDTASYDLVVIDGSYVPGLSEAGLLARWDKERVPGLTGVSKRFLAQPAWDPTNDFGIPKTAGSTGWVWDSAHLTRAPETWNDFFAAAADPAVAGKVTVLDSAASLVSSYFWGNGIDDRTTRQADYQAAGDRLRETVLPHLRSFESYPATDLTAGNVRLAQAYTGDARRALLEGPPTLRFALGAPQTDLYVDHWVLPAASTSCAAAHAFVQFLLEPDNAAAETVEHGYYTGVEASRALLPKDFAHPEVVFFDQGQPASRFVPAREDPQSRRLSVATFQRLKAQASQR